MRLLAFLQKLRAVAPAPRSFWRENGLSLVTAAIFAVLLFGQSWAGLFELNAQREQHGQPPVAYGAYLTNPHFFEATFENWESEFLQMGFYVVLTVFLYQRGSAESKRLEREEDVDADPRSERSSDSPWPVRRGGIALKFYEHSLSICFLGLFMFCFTLHALSGWRLQNAELLEHGRPVISLGHYVTSARFWFESLQNWQSEFLAVGAIVVLSIYLRERGSPESKPVAAAHAETGG